MIYGFQTVKHNHQRTFMQPPKKRKASGMYLANDTWIRSFSTTTKSWSSVQKISEIQLWPRDDSDASESPHRWGFVSPLKVIGKNMKKSSFGSTPPPSSSGKWRFSFRISFEKCNNRGGDSYWVGVDPNHPHWPQVFSMPPRSVALDPLRPAASAPLADLKNATVPRGVLQITHQDSLLADRKKVGEKE